ncbi:MAG: VCBS repeat-containing protein, partial [Proteobacteria bacterium]|nr:VCBS repeat-containing protein [Pseudomonadota bacterium]
GGFQCIEDTCQYVTDSQVLGGACDELKKCASGTVCQNGKCMTPGKEGDACDEEQLTTCAAGMMCVLGQCIPVSGECQKSEDCTEKDSYCCQSETCGAIGYCIPYDDNTTHDAMCLFKTKPGIFEAQIQCRWQPPSDFESGSKSVEIPPLVGRFGNSAGLETVIAVWSYNPTVLRFIHPETCETLESIKVELSTRWYNYPAAADFDGDGLMELVTGTSTQTYLYKWDPTANDGKGGHVLKSKASVDYRPMSSLYDIDSDGNTEIVGAFGSVIRVKKEDLSMEVLTSKDLFLDGSFLNLAIGASKDGYLNETGQDAAIGNIDADPEGIAELITAEGLYTWDGATKAWKRLLTFPWHSTSASGWVRQFPAYADFGTYHAADGSFDYQTLDGKPEIVISGKNKMQIYAIHKDDAGHWSSKSLMSVGGFTRGGPVTIGDFNNDGLPEIGIAANGTFGVYDPKCTAYKEGECADKYVMWERWSQDNSSGTTGSSLFDFDGDGQAEAVYADECYTRVYDGKTGRVLFSAPRSSVTSIEGPVIADIDNDGSTEILMASDQNYACYNDGGGSKVYSGVDPIHEGIRCEADEDCPTSKNCDKTLGLCLCETDNDCNTQYIGGQLFKQYTCTSPIHKDVGFMRNATGTASSRTMAKNRGIRPDGWASGDYKVCRAWRDTTGAKQAGVTDLMVYKDRLDRWVSSRNLWNQHAYNIINIKDDGTVTDNATWYKNWLLKKVGEYITGTTQERPKYNNYRMNEQGLYGAGTVPDITGRFILGNICGETEDGRKVISGKLCNRGTKPVATNLPATFFYYDETAPEGRGEKICTSYTPGIVGVGECQHVGCTVEESVFEGLQGKKVLMVTNLNEYDQSSTVECNYNNNTDTITIDKCEAEIEIVN